MKRNIAALLLLLAALHWGCNQDANTQLVEGHIVDNKYFNERFGMEVPIPDGWRVMTQLEEEYYRQEGRKASEQEFGENRSNTWTNLLHLQKGMSLNSMLISYSIYKPELHGPNYQMSKETRFTGAQRILENNPGIEIESVRTITDIGDSEFDTYNMMIKSGEAVKGYQILLEHKYENDEVLLVSLTTDNREALEELRVLLGAMKVDRRE
ncbi:MAG: hypothetical protein AAF391_04115 [Bacteroidota bacterium]